MKWSSESAELMKMLYEISRTIIKMWFAIRFHWPTSWRTARIENESTVYRGRSRNLMKSVFECIQWNRKKKEKESNLSFPPFRLQCQLLVQTEPKAFMVLFFFWNFSYLSWNDLSVWNIIKTQILFHNITEWDSLIKMSIKLDSNQYR